MQRNSANNEPTRRSVVTRSPLWRGVVGVIAAYSLVITAVLSGFILAEWDSLAAVGLVGEHCATDARAAGMDPAAPAGQPHDMSRCALCTLAAGSGVLPVAPVFALAMLPRTGAPESGSDRDFLCRPGHPGKLPRGPPDTGVAA